MRFSFRRREQGQVRISLSVLDDVALRERLAEYEDRYAIQCGLRITSAQFHDLYVHGEVEDFADAMEWATYYELLREHGRGAIEKSSISDADPRLVIAR